MGLGDSDVHREGWLVPVWHGSPLQRRQGRAGRGVDRASGVGGAGIGPSTGRIQTCPGAPGGASGDWFSLGACGIPR